MIDRNGGPMNRWHRNLGEFINVLRAARELRVVDREVSPVLEISRLTDLESKKPGGGQALFFPKVKGSEFPVATNLLGSHRRIGLALGVTRLDDLGLRVKKFLELGPPRSLGEALKMGPMLWSVIRAFPRRHRRGRPPCQEVVMSGASVDLGRLPILTTWPKDAGPFVTLPLVITKSLATGRRNLGMYRMQVHDRATTGMHWHVHKDGAHFFQEYRKAGLRMPVAVAIGADPAVMYAATAPLPRNIDEMALAGFIRNRSVPLTRCLTVDLDVPAEAEFVLEGYVDPHELRREGPFGDHTGYYSLADDYPVFHVTAITHRRSPVYPATVVGPPPMEDCYMGLATERLFLPMIQSVFPEIVDYHLPWAGVFHNAVVVSIQKAYPGHAQKVMHGLWGQGQMSFCKTIVVVDEDVDPQDRLAVVRVLLERLDVTTDLTLTSGVLDVLDHSSPTPQYGAKLGIDLTKRFPGEPPRRTPNHALSGAGPDVAAVLSDLRGQVDGVLEIRFLGGPWSEAANRVLLATVDKAGEVSGRYFAERLLRTDGPRPFNIMVLLDQNVDLSDYAKILWKLWNNTDPKRDLYREDNRVVIDACEKGPADGHFREWPEELTFD